jgi:choline dehydrogenase
VSEPVYDVVVVGGGSAGCVLAGRLAELGSLSVCVIELGAAAERHPEVLRADGYKDAFRNDALIWERYSAPQRAVAGRSVFTGTGTGMGGSGSVNGMVYTRGCAQDYEGWPAGWRWDDVLPHFERLEQVLRPNRRAPTRWTEAVLSSAAHAGFRLREDLNDGDLSGVMGYEWMNYEGEQRRSSYVAYVKERARDNLTVLTEARVRRVRFEGDRAVGVEIEREGVRSLVRARREVVLCAGALESPKLLLLSGVGPGAHLREHGVQLVHDLPAVGENLHDHPNVPLFFLGRGPVDCHYPQVYGFDRVNSDLPLRDPAQPDTCYVAWPAVSALREAMERMLPALVLPRGLRKHAGAKAVVRSGVKMLFAPRLTRDVVARVWGVVVILGKPCSRGSLRLGSPDVREDAVIDPAWLSDERDLETLRRGVSRARALALAPGLTAWGNKELSPGWLDRGPASLDRWIRGNLMTTYHFAGTCRMGEDAGSVVDAALRVRGVRGLRVADASVIPETPVSALNAPSMMIGLRAAELIAGGEA